MVLVFFLPLLALGLALSLRPFPLRVDAVDAKERFGQHCRRVSFFLLAIPFVVIGAVTVLLVERFSGGPGLLAYQGFLSIGGKLWIWSSVTGILSGIGGCFPLKRRSDGYALVAVHVVLLFLVFFAPNLQYAGHPD